MDSAKVNDWLQVIGLFGVIASLLFVGMQMKQEHEIAVASAYQARSEQITGLAAQYWTDPVVRSGVSKIQTGRPDEITPDESIAINAMISGVFNFYENVHFQYQNGFITEEHWVKSRFGMKNLLQDPAPRNVVLSETSGWRASFRLLLEEIISEIEAEQGNQ